MKDKIEALLEKYWNGTSSLEEEKELKSLLTHSSDFPQERSFFEDLDDFAQLGPADIIKPEPKSIWLQHVWKVAAVFVLFLISAILVFQAEERRKEEEAYRQVMEAFAMIQENMQKGTVQMENMREFRHLNTSHEIFNLKETK
jgi:hypothetical protein